MDRLRPDHLSAVHGRSYLSGGRVHGREPTSSTSAPDRATRPPCSPRWEDGETVERHPELAERARRNLESAGYGDRVTVHVGDGTLGLPEEAPFDAIAVAAAAPRFPGTLFDQLAPVGRLVVPVGGRYGQRLEVIVATPEGPAVARSVPCRFVPLVGAEGF